MVNANAAERHPDVVLEELGARFGEYAVTLSTRRIWALGANELIKRRQSAPSAIRADRRSYADVRETG